MSDGQDPKPNNTGGYSADYVKELREEAAGWRTKFREAETSIQEMKTQLGQMEHSFTVKSELDKRGINVDPSWIKVEEGKNPSEAIDAFIEKYPQFKNESPSPQPGPSPTPKPMRTEKKNSNAPSVQNSDYKSVKQDPVARAKLRDMYRSMLSDDNPGLKL